MIRWNDSNDHWGGDITECDKNSAMLLRRRCVMQRRPVRQCEGANNSCWHCSQGYHCHAPVVVLVFQKGEHSHCQMSLLQMSAANDDGQKGCQSLSIGTTTGMFEAWVLCYLNKRDGNPNNECRSISSNSSNHRWGHHICNSNRGDVRVLIYVSISFVHSDYIISTGIGFRVASSAVAFP